MTTADEMLADITRGEKLWPHNAHLLEDPRIEDAVRFVLKDRGGAVYPDGPAMITPLELGDLPFHHHHDLPGWGNTDSLIGLQTNVAMLPISDEVSMLTAMDYVRNKVATYREAALTCCLCHQPIHTKSGWLEGQPNSFELIWVSAPPSIVGLVFCKRPAPPAEMPERMHEDFFAGHNDCGPKIIADYNPVLI